MSDRIGTASRIAIECPIEFQREHRGRKRMGAPPASPVIPIEPGNIPRVSKLLALAHRFEHLVREGAVRDYADLARLGGVSRARVTQLMNLLLLAPEIQAEILFFPKVTEGKGSVFERRLRALAAQPVWAAQHREWSRLRKAEGRRLNSETDSPGALR